MVKVIYIIFSWFVVYMNNQMGKVTIIHNSTLHIFLEFQSKTWKTCRNCLRVIFKCKSSSRFQNLCLSFNSLMVHFNQFNSFIHEIHKLLKRVAVSKMNETVSRCLCLIYIFYYAIKFFGFTGPGLLSIENHSFSKSSDKRSHVKRVAHFKHRENIMHNIINVQTITVIVTSQLRLYSCQCEQMEIR